MQKRKLGNSGLEFSTIGLGTWAIGGSGWAFSWGEQDDRDSIAAIHRAVDLGVNWIDTAAVYGVGHAEEVVGRALKTIEPSRRPLVATKFSRLVQPDGSIQGVLTPESVRGECEASLRRLGVESIDLYQMHWPDPPEDIEAAWETLVELKAEGKVRHIGVSNFDLQQMERLQAIHPIASLQPPYNMIVRRIEDGVLEFCATHGIGVIVYSPMCKGLLTGSFDAARLAALPEEDHRSRDPKFATPQVEVHLDLVEGLRGIAEDKGRPLHELAIAWVLRRAEVTSAIVGARRPEQIEGTAPASEWQLSAAESEAIDGLLEEHRRTLETLGAVDTGRV